MLKIENRIKKIISKQLGIKIEKLSNQLNYTYDLGADSLDMVELIMSLEEEFKINISDEHMNNIHTIEDTINYIKDKKK